MHWDQTPCECRLSSPCLTTALGWFSGGGEKTPCPAPAKPSCPPAKPAPSSNPCKKQSEPVGCKKTTLPRATNPFLVFYLEMLKNCPGRSVTQVAKAAGKQWCSMDWEKRQPYIQRALAERRRLKRSCKPKRKLKRSCKPKRKRKSSCKRKRKPKLICSRPKRKCR